MLKLKQVEEVLFFLTILFLPTQLGRHFWPQFSYVYSLPVDYLSPILYFWDIMVGFLWVVFLISKKHINRIALSFLYFFLLTQSLSLLSGANIGIGLIRLEQYLIAGLFGVYVASLKKGEIRKIYLPLTLAVSAEVVLAVLQFLKGGSVGFWILGERSFSLSTPAIAKFDFYGREFLRPYGTFPHPNVLAGFMVIATLLLPFRGHLFNWIPAFAGMTILLTVSRTAVIAGFVAGLFLLTKKWKMLLVILALILSPFLYTRFSSLFNYDQLTFLRREELSLTALSIFLKNPLFGVGLNNFIPAGADLLLAGPSRFLQPVHNIFLLTLSETGLIGLIGLISLVGYPVWMLFKLRTTNYELRTLLLVWASLIFLGLFDHYFLTLPQGYRLLFLVWGVSFCMLEWMDAKSS